MAQQWDGGACARALTRRQVIGSAVVTAGALSWSGLADRLIGRALAYPVSAGASLREIEHVVILIQENRSFDHYFGTLRGVQGFSDPAAIHDPTGRSVFDQPDPDVRFNTTGHLLPWHLDAVATSGACLPDITHAWSAMHYAWNNGMLDGFVAAHRVGDGGGSAAAPGCMGYYTRADLPFHYALADAFTICDGYHCSVFGPTNPNRIMSLSATIDPDGAMGGPCIDNNQSNGQLDWETYPERLQEAGITWFVYQESDNDTNNMLPFFTAYQDPHSDLYRRANTIIATPKGAPFGPALAAQLKADVLARRLPQVSWILASSADCEHPSAPPASGARFIAGVLDALTADPETWAKTVLFITYDENGGFFDHVPPPTAPAGTAGEWVSVPAGTVPSPKDPTIAESSLGQYGPVGLGFRVPMLVVSPFSTGGKVCSEVFDHTSLLRFLEQRFGVQVPNLSAWRRANTGDLTATLSCASAAARRLPPLPEAQALEPAQVAACRSDPAAQPPYSNQAMPRQEPGTRPRVGSCEPAARGVPTSAGHQRRTRGHHRAHGLGRS